ncbi:MAG: D-sedoheptulose 7-phosphate isomerase [Thermodesulfobacteriota bacterium]
MSKTALDIVHRHSILGSEVRNQFFSENGEKLISLSKAAAVCLARGGKIMFCGNGGSAADCQHLAAEFVNRFCMERPPLPALALTTDSSILTAISNDYSFMEVFAKQVKALGSEGDMLVGISTSGNSPNVREAVIQAREKEIITVGMTGSGGRSILEFCEFGLIIPSDDTPIIQEVHIAAGHMICYLVDHFLFEAVGELEL